MAKIGRSFDELDQRIKSLNSNIKQTSGNVKALDKDLKMNPGDVDKVRQKFTLLSTNLQTATQKLAALQEKQKRLTADFNSGAITQDTYNRQLAKTTKEAEAAEKQIAELNRQLSQQNSEIRNAKLEKLQSGLNGVEKAASAVRNVVLGVTTALVAMFASAVKVGDELSDTATHFGTTVENLQIWQNRLGMLAKDQEAYTKSLEKVGSVMTSIIAGRGARYLTYLEQLGIAQEDLQGKSNGEVFDMIYNGLRNVTDETQRSLIAQGLLGDTGLEIAVIAGTQAGAIDELDQALIENGIITTEQAKAADEAANKMLALKQRYQATSMELMESAMPAFETLVELLKTAVIPVITKISDWLGSMNPAQQKFLLLLVGVALVLPTIIKLATGIVTVVKAITAAKIGHTAATYGQAAAMGTLTAAAGPWLGIITAISLALLLLIKIIGWFIGASTDAVDSANGLLDKMNEVDNKATQMGYDAEYSAETTYDTNSHKTIDINLDVNASGDGTEVGRENAEIIADELEDRLLVDLLNQGMGAVVR